MYEKIEALDPLTHTDLRLATVRSFSFSKNVSSVKVSSSELRDAARYFPIIFSESSGCIPQALLSVEPNVNAFVDGDGNWTCPYVPTYVRLYPFTLARIQGQEEKFALCIDPDAEHFKSGMGDPLFTADGELTEFIQKKVFNVLVMYQKELEITQALFKFLDDKKLITDRTFNYSINGEDKSIDGFKGVDMEKLMNCDDNSLACMVRNGTIGMVYEHSISLANFSSLLRLMVPDLKIS